MKALSLDLRERILETLKTERHPSSLRSQPELGEETAVEGGADRKGRQGPPPVESDSYRAK
jgi:hypothetical protein